MLEVPMKITKDKFLNFQIFDVSQEQFEQDTFLL